MRRWAFLGLAAAVFITMGLAVAIKTLTTSDNSQSGWGGRSTPVAAYQVREHAFADIVEALGTAGSNETVTVTAKVSDTISRINFDSGDTVQQGDILAELTDTEEAADLSEARATLEEAIQELNRTEDLSSRGVAPQSRLDEANASVQRARARVNALEARMADRIIRAPFSGVVGLRQVSVGELVRPGDVVASLDDTSLIKLDFTVPERFLSVLERGMNVQATTTAFEDVVFSGEIAQLDSRVDPITRTITVRAEIANEDGRLRPGQLMNVEVRRDERMRPAIPGSAITRHLDDTFVFVIDEGERGSQTREQFVELGRRDNDLVEVVSGLEAGAVIVKEGVHRVRDGGTVEIASRDNVSLPSGDGTTTVGAAQ